MYRARAVSLAAVGVSAAATTAGVAGLASTGGLSDTAWFVVAVISGIPALVLGVAVTGLRGNAVGEGLAIAGATVICTAGIETALRVSMAAGGFPGAEIMVALGAGSWMVLYLPWAWLLLIFPDGRFRSGFDRVVAWTLPTIWVAFTLLVAVAPEPYPTPYEQLAHPFGTVPWAGVAAVAILPCFLAALVASAVSPFRRYRRSSPRERLQLRWLALAGISVPGGLLISWLGHLALGGAEIVPIGLALMNVAVPVAVATALLRLDDVDIDRVVISVVAWWVILLCLVTVVALVTPLTNGLAARGAALVAAGMTAGAILVIVSLRTWLERRIGAFLFPRRERALTALADLHARVHSGQDQPEAIETILRHTLRDPALRVGYARNDDSGFDGADGDAVSAPEPESDSALGVVLSGRRIAIIVGSPGQPPVPREVATAASTLAEMTRLRMELASALRDVEASRERILLAGDEERHRLERDLHDGAQQRLVSIGMSLRLAQRRLGRGELDIEPVLERTIDGLARSVAELRQVAHGLRPSSLDDGLPAALVHLSSASPIPIDLDLDANDELPDSVSTTAYFVASEAVTNAVKHAGAARVALRVSRTTGSLLVRVLDDGCGGATLRPGGGLAGLADRVDALGGDFSVGPAPGGGTRVEARLPCGS